MNRLNIAKLYVYILKEITIPTRTYNGITALDTGNTTLLETGHSGHRSSPGEVTWLHGVMRFRSRSKNQALLLTHVLPHYTENGRANLTDLPAQGELLSAAKRAGVHILLVCSHPEEQDISSLLFKQDEQTTASLTHAAESTEKPRAWTFSL